MDVTLRALFYLLLIAAASAVFYEHEEEDYTNGLRNSRLCHNCGNNNGQGTASHRNTTSYKGNYYELDNRMKALEDGVRDTLIAKCNKAKEFSHSPYSKFRVGAALLTTSGETFTGCNVENASYGLAVCAERTAYCKAVSEGYKSFRAIAISSDLINRHIVPCGMCRQFMAEFADDTGNLTVIMTKPDGSFVERTLAELLPECFQPKQLEEERLPDQNHNTCS